MNIDLLIKMANQISDFFQGTTDPEKAAADVATHLRRYWDPRMRTQIVTYCAERHGAGLTSTAIAGVQLLGQQENKTGVAGAASTASTGAAAPGPKS
jgi:formate dehydrogenase subunit delta